MGTIGNKAADDLTKRAYSEGLPVFLPASRCHSKKELSNISINRWQREWHTDSAGRNINYPLNPGKGRKSNLQRRMVPSQANYKGST
ncbi:hypothetical protein HNY73_019400 [Argiope bruennichi]|uniref:Uncharacterized protein n=1 Tax=Argiope bruennichi TaxID=94029 RepID=A0A8T0EK86_ARGBR|nr:hypothetical protein HNY73_019400 [Argiope bruennichi]